MKAKNEMVVISGILVLLATATISAASYNVQTAKAAANPSPFGKIVSGFATSGTLCVPSKTCDKQPGIGSNPGGGNAFGQAVSAAANPNK